MSLDFELFWGLRDKFLFENCRRGMDGERQAIPEILRLFQEYGVHATWAVVGLLFYSHKDALLQGLPTVLPNYNNTNLNPYNVLDTIGRTELNDPYHYAPSLIREIASIPEQEIASHTFSHYYCLEQGQSKDSFKADLEAAIIAAHSFNIELKSLVFPRNQCNKEYLDICRELGFIAYRGNPHSWMYTASDDQHQNLVKRAGRLCDAYINLSGRHCYDFSTLVSSAPVNIPASRFLRPYLKRLASLEPLRLRRIKNDMTYAARHGQLFHLWWHPFNFGISMSENLGFLKEILSYYQYLKERYHMCSLNMAELAGKLISIGPTVRELSWAR